MSTIQHRYPKFKSILKQFITLILLNTIYLLSGLLNCISQSLVCSFELKIGRNTEERHFLIRLVSIPVLWHSLLLLLSAKAVKEARVLRRSRFEQYCQALLLQVIPPHLLELFFCTINLAVLRLLSLIQNLCQYARANSTGIMTKITFESAGFEFLCKLRLILLKHHQENDDCAGTTTA